MGDVLLDLLHRYGYGVIGLVIFVESMGVPAPGESLLLGAALYAAATGRIDIGMVVGFAAVGAVLGDNAGYAIGRSAGVRLLTRYGPRVGLTEGRISLGAYLFRRHGGKVVFFGRFIAVLRTFAALLAGANRMPWGRFLLWNAAGGIGWTCLYGFGTYFLGDIVRRLATPVAVGAGIIVVIVAIPVVLSIRRNEATWIRRAEEAADRERGVSPAD